MLPFLVLVEISKRPFYMPHISQIYFMLYFDMKFEIMELITDTVFRDSTPLSSFMMFYLIETYTTQKKDIYMVENVR